MKFKIFSYVVLLFVWVHSLSTKTHLLYTHQWKCQEIFRVFSHVTITSCLHRFIDLLWLHEKSRLLHQKKNIQVKWFGICTALLSEEKPSPQLRTSFGDGSWAVLKSSTRVFSIGGEGEGASVSTSQSAKTQKDTTRRENLT